MKRHFTRNEHHSILTFNESEVTYHSITEFTVEDESGEFRTFYSEEKGDVWNDVVDGILLIETSLQRVTIGEYFEFLNLSYNLEPISEIDLIKKMTLSIHGDYVDPPF